MAETATLKTRLGQGERLFGCWLETFSPVATEIVAEAGYDFVMVDLEHGPGGPGELLSLLHAIKGSDSVPLVRVAANDPVEIKRVLDLGVRGLMIPAVNSAREARAAVAACRYPPRGLRGVAPTIVRASGYGARWRDYVATADDVLLIICQIETGQAVREAGEIAAQDGVDALFIGPFDLSASLGHLGEPDHPEVHAAISRAEAAAREHRRHLGGIATPRRDDGALLEAGYGLILSDADSLLLRDAARASVARFRDRLGGRSGS